MTHRLTYPAPRRCSSPTGSRREPRRIWRLVKSKKSEYNIFGLNLEPVDITVEQRMFTSEPWGVSSALSVIQSGGWFDGSEEFESKSAKKFAMDAQAAWQLIHEEIENHA